MGVYSNTVSMTQFIISGDLPDIDDSKWFCEKFSGRLFQSIENSTDELSEGWTQTDHPDNASFESPSDFWRDNYLLVSMRRDQRKIPAAVLKSHTSREEAAFLVEHPNLRRTPKGKREEIKELVQIRLMSRCLPIPATTDLVWDRKSNTLSLFGAGSKVLERFEDLFRKTFEGFHLLAIHPFARARMLLEGGTLDLLEKANQANSDSAAALIRDNQWLGWEFQLWLLYRSLNDAGDFNICQPGHFSNGERFSSWIDDRIQMQGGSEEGGIQKVSVSGSQDSYMEAITALRGGKVITSSTICMEKDENLWKVTLKGETFTFASFKTPQIRIERDDTVEEMSEREAAFYERMYLLEQGEQLFDSVCTTFLKERLSDNWGSRMKAIQEWLEGK
jgi:hypothetical protein